MAVLATGAVGALLAAFPALAAGAAHRITDRPALRLLLAWPGAWALSEWLRGTVLSGLPWIASGYAHTDGPLAGYAPIVGVYGICLISALIAGAAVCLIRGPGAVRWAALAGALLLAASGQWLRGIEWTHATG